MKPKKMKGDGKETSFHPQLICPVVAQPGDRDALMSKKNTSLSSCVRVNTAHTVSRGDVKVPSLISQDVTCATCVYYIAAALL